MDFLIYEREVLKEAFSSAVSPSADINQNLNNALYREAVNSKIFMM